MKHYAYTEGGHVWVPTANPKKTGETCSKCRKVRYPDQAKKVPECKVPASPPVFGTW